MRFSTGLFYTGRQSKLAYVFDKYGEILKDSILDVGSDECHLRELLDPGIRYVGVGLGGSPDIEVDLEKCALPFPDNSFECVLCLDVLEHLDNIHRTFDELCRVSKRHVIISLPNPYHDFAGMLLASEQGRASNFKYYGLPPERPDDRHKWFFSSIEAEEFIRHRAGRNGMNVVQIDNDGAGPARTLASRAKRMALGAVSQALSVKPKELYYKTTWAVLEKS